jgi:RNA polymerase subunit RPABC4/transcription elongation factor Spt4
MESELQCSNCELELTNEDEFCPRCGCLFDESVKCYNHELKIAEGVCVICNYAFCEKCGMFVNDVFLCAEHEHYEIYQSLAVVALCKNAYESESLKNSLIATGLHPFMFTGNNKPTTYTPSTESNNQNALEVAIYGRSEIKILVPLGEVLDAEKLLLDEDKTCES